MSTLAEIKREGVGYRLPLTHQAAIALATALAADEPAARHDLLAAALRQDPALALWCVLQAPAPPPGASWTSALADWLAPQLRELVVGLCPGAPRAFLPGKQGSRGLSLLARSRAVARAAAAAVGPESDAVLVGLLHRAADWLALSGAPRPTPRAAAQILPEALAAVLARLRKASLSPADSLESGVRAAIAAAGADPSADEFTRDGSTAECALAADDLVGLLAQLARQAAKQERLAADFDRAVEHAKLEALKEFAYGAGHEINNPLANISARAQTLLKEESDPERRQKLAAINTQAFRAHEMIADLMLFARPPELKPERIELRAFLEELARSWHDQASSQASEVHVSAAGEAAEPPVVWADRSALAVAVRALVINALEALGRGGRVEVTVDRATLGGVNGAAGTAALAIRVHDNGPGIPAEIRPRIFDPYFSGREAGRGLGFGLCKCWRIVTAHGGRVDVSSEVGRGTELAIVLPIDGGQSR